MSRQQTPNYDFDTPNLDETPDVPRDLRTLAMGVDSALDVVEARFTWQPYSVVWSQFGGTVLNIGNGTLTSRFMKQGHLVAYRVTLIRGTTTNVGTTDYLLSVPVAARADGLHMGSGMTIGEAGGVHDVLGVRWVNSTTVAMAVARTSEPLGPSTYDWEAGNGFFIGGTYEAA